MVSLDIRTAFAYPWRPENRFHALGVPVILTYSALVVWAILSFFLSFITKPVLSVWGEEALLTNPVLTSFLLGIVFFPLKVLFSAWIWGYAWHFFEAFQQYGPQCSLPPSTGHTGKFLKHGAKIVAIYCMAVVILTTALGTTLLCIQGLVPPTAIALQTGLSLGVTSAIGMMFLLIWPFGIGMMAQSARERTFSAMFKWRRTLHITFQAYPTFWGALLLGMVATLSASLLLSLTCLGVLLLPVVWIPFFWTTCHLWAQGFQSGLDHSVKPLTEETAPG